MNFYRFKIRQLEKNKEEIIEKIKYLESIEELDDEVVAENINMSIIMLESDLKSLEYRLLDVLNKWIHISNLTPYNWVKLNDYEENFYIDQAIVSERDMMSCQDITKFGIEYRQNPPKTLHDIVITYDKLTFTEGAHKFRIFQRTISKDNMYISQYCINQEMARFDFLKSEYDSVGPWKQHKHLCIINVDSAGTIQDIKCNKDEIELMDVNL